ncbi:uncharacterized protein LOC106091177 [Stomoxys calcitrans]|uniref:INO80 complex subunit F domain-containing protein n=1 Tax=Stomoxys calcitrans TaxID=35570 RepID=A0A1I8NZR4_STOCA|nr:uncharacterized protein LOC106091177 [Stomoxys calcitrans]
MLINEKEENYKRFVEKLIRRCQEIQIENERCVLRINNVKKIIRRRVRDVEILKVRLDRHNDAWRSLPMVAPHPKRKIEQKRGPKPKNKDNNAETGSNKEKKPRKQRVKKSSSDDKLLLGGSTVAAVDVQDMLYQESQAQQLLMMQQRQINLKNDLLS